MVVDEHFRARARMKLARAAVRSNVGLRNSGPQHSVLVSFFEDLIAGLADQRPKQRDEVFRYVVSTMGAVAGRHAGSSPKPHGQGATASNGSASTDSGATAKPAWVYPVVHKPLAGGSGRIDGEFREISALRMFGYTVGKTNGWRQAKRHAFLTDFMEKDLPSIVAQEYGNEYGAPMTTNRLRKVANVIATNASNAFRNDARRFEVAIADWEHDLLFLRDRYYEGMGMKFQPWPSTRPEIAAAE